MKLSDDKKLKIYTHEMNANFQGQSIKVSKIDYKHFPEKGDSNYPEFTEWLKDNIKLHNICLEENGLLDPKMHFDSSFFYKLEGFKGRGIEITEKELVITREELGNYILSIMDTPATRNLENKNACAYDTTIDALWVIEACYDDENGEAVVSQGTGFQLKDIGIITCAHVISDKGKNYKNLEAFKVSNPSVRYELIINTICDHRDIAICSIPIEKNPPKDCVDMSHNDIKMQQEVKLLGFPAFAPGQSHFIADTKIAKVYNQSAIPKFEIDQQIREGNSGGPIIDSHCNVVGIALEGATKDSGNNGCLIISEIKQIMRQDRGRDRS